MRKRASFDTYWGEGWPDPEWLEPYFLTPAGQRKICPHDNDSWGLTVEGIDGTEHLRPYKDRIDINLWIQGHRDLGVLLGHVTGGGGRGKAYYSKGDLRRLREWVKTFRGDRMPVGLFIPFETAWNAVKEFIERDGALPGSIEWVAATDLPAGTFPLP